MFEKLKNFWFNLTHVKCDYCKTPVKEYYDAFSFGVPEYKGNRICIECIEKLPKKRNIISQ